jgi:hypothetical protein
LKLPPEEPMPPSPLTIRHAFAFLATCTACELAQGAEWSAQPSIQWYLDYDTNRRLAPAGQGEVPDDAGYMTLDMLLQRLTATDEFDFHPQVEFQRFTRDTALNATDESLQLAASHHEQLWSVLTQAGYSHTSTLITEIASTGIIDANTRQDALTGDVNATRQLSARQSLTADVSYSDITYPGGLADGLAGYRSTRGSLSYAWQYSPSTKASLIGFAGDVSSEISSRSEQDGARLQLDHSFTSLLSLTLNLGESRARIEGSEGSGAVWGLSLVRRIDIEGKWSLSVSRDVEPNGRGLLIDHEEADLSLTRAIAPHLFYTVTATAIRNSDVFSSITFDDRRYYAGALGLEWHPTKLWQVNFIGGYSQATEPFPYLFAHGWRAAITLRWTPHPWAVSR